MLAETFDDRATKEDECVVDALLLRIIHESASIVGVGREYYLCQDIAELSHIALKFPEITKVIDDVAKESGNHNTKIATAVLSELGVTVEELVVKDDHVYDALLSIMKNWIVPALVKKSFDRGLSTEVVKKDYEDIMNILFYTRVAKLKDDKDKQDKPSNEEFMEPCNALVSHLIFIEDTKNNAEQAPKKVHVLCETPLEKLKYLFTTDDTGRKYRKPGQKKSKPPKKDENINTGLTKSASVRRRSLGGLSTPGSARRGSLADTGGSVLKSRSSTAKRSGGSDGSTRKLSTPGSARRGSFADTGGSVLKSKSSTAKRSGRSDGSTRKLSTPGSARRGSLADNGGSGNSSVIDTPSGSKRKSINNLARAIDFEEFDYPIVKRKTRASVAKGAAKNAGKCTNKKNTAKKSAASTAKSTRLRSKNN